MCAGCKKLVFFAPFTVDDKFVVTTLLFDIQKCTDTDGEKKDHISYLIIENGVRLVELDGWRRKARKISSPLPYLSLSPFLSLLLQITFEVHTTPSPSFSYG